MEKTNHLLYLYQQSSIKTLESAALGGVIFILTGLMVLLITGEWPPVPTIFSVWTGWVFGLFAVFLLVGLIVGGGMLLALWLIWHFHDGKFSRSEIIATSGIIGMTAWLGFFGLVVAPEAQFLWGDYFAAHPWLAVFFDSLGLSLGLGSGLWAGWRLYGVLDRQKSLTPEWFQGFQVNWKMDGWRAHWRLLGQGGGLGLLCALLTSLIFALGLVGITGIGIVLSAQANESVLPSLGILFLLSLVVAGLAFALSAIPSAIGGYLIAYLFYLSALNETLTKKTAFWLAGSLAAAAAFGMSVVVSGLYMTSPHFGSMLSVTPAIFGITFFAWLLGGRAGQVLYSQMQKPTFEKNLLNQ